MKHVRDSWDDENDGLLVRPYAVTRGRTKPSRPDLDLITLVVAGKDENVAVDAEYAEIQRICQDPLSVAEISATLGMPLTVVKILVADLIDQGYLIFSSPPSPTNTDSPDMNILQAVLDGIRRL